MEIYSETVTDVGAETQTDNLTDVLHRSEGSIEKWVKSCGGTERSQESCRYGRERRGLSLQCSLLPSGFCPAHPPASASCRHPACDYECPHFGLLFARHRGLSRRRPGFRKCRRGRDSH